LLAAQKVGPSGRVIGVDMTDAMIARAHENIRSAGVSNVEVRKGLLTPVPGMTLNCPLFTRRREILWVP
jgi:arsenite methyltransferase